MVEWWDVLQSGLPAAIEPHKWMATGRDIGVTAALLSIIIWLLRIQFKTYKLILEREFRRDDKPRNHEDDGT